MCGASPIPRTGDWWITDGTEQQKVDDIIRGPLRAAAPAAEASGTESEHSEAGSVVASVAAEQEYPEPEDDDDDDDGVPEPDDDEPTDDDLPPLEDYVSENVVLKVSAKKPGRYYVHHLQMGKSKYLDYSLSDIEGATDFKVGVHNGIEYIYPVVPGGDPEALQPYCQTVPRPLRGLYEP